MSTYKSFAVAGAGLIGTPIVTALVEKGVSVVVLSRTSKPAPEGTTVAAVDYNDVPALTETLKKHAVDVVISTFGNEGFSVQPALADAAKAAGVKLFVPSEFGSPTEGVEEGLLKGKALFAQHLAEIGLPFSRIYTGGFMHHIPWVVGLPETGKVNIIGKGDAPISATAETDIAGFTAHILTTLPHAELANKTFRIQGDRVTLREFAALLGKPVVFHEGPPAELSHFQGVFLTFAEAGMVNTGYDHVAKKDVGSAGEANDLWPGHHWVTLKEYYKV